MASKKKANLVERLIPSLVIVSIVLAFAVGVLWNKVSILESGGVKGTGGNVAAQPSGNTAGAEPAAPSVLNDLESVAEEVGVDVGKFTSCIEDKKYADIVQASYQTGIDAGITGTPGNIVMNQNGEAWLLPGAVPLETLKAAVDEALGITSGAAQGKLDESRASSIAKVTGDDHIRGSQNAKVFLIEYSDFQCPFCQRFHPTAKQMLDEYGNDVAWVYRHFPLDQIHPLARPAAIASECVADLGGEDAFWQFTDIVFGG